jgi:hypothetical protein
MKGLEITMYAVMLLVSNLAAILFLVVSVKMPRVGRALFGLLFTASAVATWYTVVNNPEFYLDYRNFAVIQYFPKFIDGWFRQNELLSIGFLAALQLLIAVGLQVNGTIFRIAGVLAIVFFLSAIPLGIGAAFPATAIMAFAVFFLLRPFPSTAIPMHHNKHALQ